MKREFAVLLVLIFCFAGIYMAHAQSLTGAVNNTISQDNQRIQVDNLAISQLQTRINVLNADMASAQKDLNSYTGLIPVAQNADLSVQGTIPPVGP